MSVQSSVTNVWSSQSLTAGAGNTTSSATSVGSGYGTVAIGNITNGGTGPTVAAQVQAQVSIDGTNYDNYGGPIVGLTSNNGVQPLYWQFPKEVQKIQFVAGSNTGQNVSVTIQVIYTTAL